MGSAPALPNEVEKQEIMRQGRTMGACEGRFGAGDLRRKVGLLKPLLLRAGLRERERARGASRSRDSEAAGAGAL